MRLGEAIRVKSPRLGPDWAWMYNDGAGASLAIKCHMVSATAVKAKLGAVATIVTIGRRAEGLWSRCGKGGQGRAVGSKDVPSVPTALLGGANTQLARAVFRRTSTGICIDLLTKIATDVLRRGRQRNRYQRRPELSATSNRARKEYQRHLGNTV